MAEFTIKDEDLTSVKGKVAIVTGGSSGIGLATVKLLLSLGASVVSGDIQPPAAGEPAETPGFQFVQTDVSKWDDLTVLFKQAKEHYGRVDCVFANAGIGPRANYFELEADDNGELKEPARDVLNVNLISVVNTASLAVHYMKQQPEGGAVVLMGSSTGLQPLRAIDYSTAKHGVLGFGRGYARILEETGLPIRLNTLMPSWTTTSVLPSMDAIMNGISHKAQDPLVVARCVVSMMVDASRHGDVIYVSDGKYTEIEKTVLAPAYNTVKGHGNPSDDEVLKRIFAFAAGQS